MKENLNAKEVLESISSTLKELDFKKMDGELTSQQLNELKEDFSKVELMGYKTKLTLAIRKLAKETPELTTKEALEKMFELLPADINPAYLSELTAHVVERWQQQTIRKSAA